MGKGVPGIGYHNCSSLPIESLGLSDTPESINTLRIIEIACVMSPSVIARPSDVGVGVRIN